MNGKVNSESDFKVFLVKNQPVEFTQENVDKVYRSLPPCEKYFEDENGNIWKYDSVGVVRDALLSLGYQLEAAWYSWGTMTPTQVTGVKVTDVSVYSSLISDIKTILQHNGIEGTITDAVIEEALLNTIDDVQFSSIREIEEKTDLVKLWYVELIIQNLDGISIDGQLIQGNRLNTIKEQISHKITENFISTMFGLKMESLEAESGKKIKYGYNLLKTVYMACLSLSLSNEENAPTINKLKKILNGLTGQEIEAKFTSLLRTFKNKGQFQEKTVNGLRQALMTLIKQTPIYSDGYLVCSKAIEQTLVYNKEFHSSIKKANKYHELFYEDWMRSYIVLSLINQFLGFDPLTFQKLDDGIFIKSDELRIKYYTDKGYKEEEIQRLENIHYVLHHINLDLEADIRKLSFEVFDLILTNSRIHPTYEGLTEAESRALVAAWEELLELDGEINIDHVKNIFKKVKVEDGKIPIYEKYEWFNDEDQFLEQLRVLNQMKVIRDNNGIETLLRDPDLGFPIAVDRWLGTNEYYQYIYTASQKIHWYLLETYY